MAYIVIVIYVICCFFALFEERIKQYRTAIYISLGFLLVLVAGLRPVGIDPDSLNYENTFLNHTSPNASDNVEYSYILFSQIINFFTNDVHVLFLFYALLGVGIKMYAFRKYSSTWFLFLALYISNYYIMHECMQIRTGVLSGLLLVALTKIGDGNRKVAAVILLIGFFFHYSALILLPILFLSNKEMNKKQRTKWLTLVFASYLIFIMGQSFFVNFGTNLPYIGNKLALYQKGTELGKISASTNVFGPIYLFGLFLYLYILYFYDTISKHNKYLPLLIKVFSLGFFFFASFSFLPVFGQRVSMLYKTVSIILFANIYYTIRPKWVAVSITAIIGLLYLNYSLPEIGLTLFWKV